VPIAEQELDGAVRRSEGTCLVWNGHVFVGVENSGSVQQNMQNLQSDGGRFHAKKFGTKTYAGANKKVALKVQTSGATKEQKIPVKAIVKDAIE
jgi:hypothetical protein